MSKGEKKHIVRNDRVCVLQNSWAQARRWEGIERPYTADDIVRLSGTVQPECTLARLGSERLWRLLQDELYVKSLSAFTGNQAFQQVRAGLNALFVSRGFGMPDASGSGEFVSEQGLTCGENLPVIVRRINNTLLRADQVQHANGEISLNCFAPIVADGEAGFGGVLNVLS
jgi:isocitrate lyase